MVLTSQPSPLLYNMQNYKNAITLISLDEAQKDAAIKYHAVSHIAYEGPAPHPYWQTEGKLISLDKAREDTRIRYRSLFRIPRFN